MPAMQTFSTAIGLLIILYLAGLLVIAQRLRTVHGEVWTGLGRPSLFNWSIANSFRLGGFVFFSGRYRGLDDRMLSGMITAIRVLAAVIVAAIVIWMTYYRGGVHP